MTTCWVNLVLGMVFTNDRNEPPTLMVSTEVQALLSTVEFADPPGAKRCLLRLFSSQVKGGSVHEFAAHLSLALSTAADPDRVLVDIERFSQVFGSGDAIVSFSNENIKLFPAESLFRFLEREPRALDILVTLFAGSQFLTEILLRSPEFFANLLDYKKLAQPKNSRQCSTEAEALLEPHETVPQKLNALRRYQRQELLRIGYCDLLDLLDLPAVIRELSSLADALIQVCLGIAADLSTVPKHGFAVIALGKLGGQELNYSSDIDLLFLARSEPGIYRRLAESLIDSLARITAEGFLYRVDMRLRPWGKDGSLVTSLEGYKTYLERHAHQWEKQALLKSRFVAGDEQVAFDFLIQSLPVVLDTRVDDLRQDVHAMKQRTESFLLEKGRTWGEVKLGAGSIRDVEFTIQFLQLAHGLQKPDILTANTLLALELLKEYQLIRSEEYRILKEGYIFLRTVEHYLQMMHYQQVNALPQDSRELSLLAQRLGFQGRNADQLFTDRYNQHRVAIREVYLQYFTKIRPDQHSGNPGELFIDMNTPDENGEDKTVEMSRRSKSGINAQPGALSRHLTRMDPSYAESFSTQEIQHHNELVQRLSDNHLVEVDARSLRDDTWEVVIVAYDYPGELSLICGMLYVHNLNIKSGSVFTYEPLDNEDADSKRVIADDHSEIVNDRRKIVDVFQVHWKNDGNADALWENYAKDLEELLRQMQAGEHNEAFSQLTRKVALKMSESSSLQVPPLYPISVNFDNTLSKNYTVLQITSQDTIGFLYELTSALAISQVYIALVKVDSQGDRIFDTLYVTGSDGKKLTDPQKQHELRSAIVLIKHFTHLLPHSANPERALLHFRGFIEKLQEQPEWTKELTSLERPEVLHALAEVLGVSDFLWEDFLRMQYENLYPVMRDIGRLAKPKSKDELYAELEHSLSSEGKKSLLPMEVFHPSDYTDPIYGAGWRSTVNALKDRELFRVDMRNILGYTDAFDQFSQELTDLAEVIVKTTARLCTQELVEQYGIPLEEDGTSCDLAICALGKCGGKELGFASDIELMFVYTKNGNTTGPKSISSAEYYEKLVQQFLSAIRTHREGVFNIDLQLRPYGKAGSLAVSMASFRKYFMPQGPAWAYERQALIRLRPIDGDERLSKQLLALRDAYVYTGEPFDVTAMRAMRERQIRHIVAGGTFNAKYSPGGLLDIEYLIQGLQINHGHQPDLVLRYPELRSSNTRQAMTALARAGIICQVDYDRLRRALTFLRWLINTLRVVRGNARDLTVPPFGSLEFEYLTRRLRYGSDILRLQDELARFTSDVQEINQRLLLR